VTDTSNDTRYLDGGNEGVPQLMLDSAVGPHFRDTRAEDIPGLAAEAEDQIDL